MRKRCWLFCFLFGLGCSATQRPDGGKGLLPAGAAAPAVTGKDDAGELVDLRKERGHLVLVFFYPKDGTPGCTREACALRDAWRDYERAGVEVLGVSSDSIESHRKFKAKHRLPFRLVSDEAGEWARAFGVGSLFGMYSRVSFLIGNDGRVLRVYPDVDPGVHAKDVLRDVHSLAGS